MSVLFGALEVPHRHILASYAGGADACAGKQGRADVADGGEPGLREHGLDLVGTT